MSKLRSGFTLLEILVVIAIIGAIYAFAFLPFSKKISQSLGEHNTLLSITKYYNIAHNAQDDKSEPLILECSDNFISCAFYDKNKNLIGNTFKLNVTDPSEAYTLTQDGFFESFWSPKMGNFRVFCAGGMPQIFIQDDKIYKIGAIEHGNFTADTKQDALILLRHNIPQNVSLLAK